ncbi:LicD family domain-containing protein [Trichoderma sp. SZMC 28013]
MKSCKSFIIAAAWTALAWGISAAPAKPNKAPEPKYFHENPYDVHYDDRYSFILLEDPEQREAIKVLVQTYLATFRDLGIQTWLMHGTLLGWWWGKKVMPWDYDADVQITEADMYLLAAYHNMTIYYYKYGTMEKGRYFQLEVNPYFVHRDQDDRSNVIDARWIDMQNGLYIDITAARYALNHDEGEGVLYDKYGHEYRDTYVFPLRDTTFEGVPCKIPYRYEEMLQAEYGKRSLTNTEYHGRANVDDESFNLDINSLDIGGLAIASSIASTSSPATRNKYSPTTSAKRRRLDKDATAPPEPKSSSTPRRRRVRSRPIEPPIELPTLPSEPMEEDGEDDGPTPKARRTYRVPMSISSVRTAGQSVEEAQDELEALPPHPGVISPVPMRSPTPAHKSDIIMEEVSESPADAPGSGKRRRVPMSETLSSTVKLMGVLSSDDGIPMPSSPLKNKARRRSGAATARSSQRSAGRVYGGHDTRHLADELSSDNLPQLAGIDEEEEFAEVEAEATDLVIEESTLAQDEDEQEEQEEDQENSDGIDVEEVARILKRGSARLPREPSPELGSQELEDAGEIEEEELEPEPESERESEPEPEPEPEEESEPDAEEATEAEEEEEEVTVLPTPPKRKRGRPSKSPATQKQPTAKSKPVKPRKRVEAQPQDASDGQEEPQPKKAKAKKRHSDQSEGDGGTIEITVQRFVNHKKRGHEDDDIDPLQNEMAFVNHGGESVIDVFAQVCDEVISSTLEQLQEVAGSAEDPAKKKEYRIKTRAIEAYREELKARFLQHAIHLNHWHSLRKRVRHVQKERMALREEIMRIKAEREQVALRMDAIRIKHEADSRESKYCLDASSLMHDVDLAVEQGREAPELSRAAQREAELANLELLVSRVSEQASSSSFTGGMLKQVKEFNSFLERAAMALESR